MKISKKNIYIGRMMKIPDKYKIYKVRFDKNFVDEININEFIDDRLYSMLHFWIMYFLLCIMMGINKRAVVIVCIYVILSTAYRKNIEKIIMPFFDRRQIKLSFFLMPYPNRNA